MGLGLGDGIGDGLGVGEGIGEGGKGSGAGVGTGKGGIGCGGKGSMRGETVMESDSARAWNGMKSGNTNWTITATDSHQKLRGGLIDISYNPFVALRWLRLLIFQRTACSFPHYSVYCMERFAASRKNPSSSADVFVSSRAGGLGFAARGLTRIAAYPCVHIVMFTAIHAYGALYAIDSISIIRVDLGTVGCRDRQPIMKLPLIFAIALGIFSGSFVLVGPCVAQVIAVPGMPQNQPTQNPVVGQPQLPLPLPEIPENPIISQTIPELKGKMHSPGFSLGSAGRGLPGMPGGPPLHASMGAQDPSPRYMRPPVIGPLFCDPAINITC